MRLRAIFITLAAVLTLMLSTQAFGAEKITNYDVKIAVQTNGDINVTESISIISEGKKIRRGIFRDLMRYYLEDGDKIPYRYTINSISLDGERVKFERESQGNAKRIRIGDADIFLKNGPHTYVINYSVKNQVRYFENYDELYWNVTGSYWAFPIDAASAAITLPNGGHMINQAGYTGRRGSKETNYTFAQTGGAYIFQTSKPLAPREGMSVALSFDKGLIDPPSAADKRYIFWARYGALAILLASFFGLLYYYIIRWRAVGRDPQKPPVFARYSPPQNYSPAALSYIYYKGFSGDKALVSTLMDLAVKGNIDIDAESKSQTKLIAPSPYQTQGEMLDDEETLFTYLFPKTPDTIVLRKKYNAQFQSAYTLWKRYMEKLYSQNYYHRNTGVMTAGAFTTMVGVVIAVLNANTWKFEYTLVLLALAALNIVFFFLMPAPTKLGQAVKSEIDGFRLYMDKAEKLQINAAKVGSDQPPPMTKERYEQYLPYAVALGVEKPWSKYFEKILPEDAADYNPGWAQLGNTAKSPSGFSRSLSQNLSSGVVNSSPPSSRSSGSSGGGFSGGGGGGGGGGGW